ncbi:dipeptidase B [Rhynchophorus ferrugineus]|uniref:dipeptidase B n=1 Tax=Rhynchophorus ferrugineus TaxID=354439 RepID=UPI003FCD0CB2
MTTTGPPITEIRVVDSLTSTGYDSIILIYIANQNIVDELQKVVAATVELDPGVDVAVVPIELPSKKLVLSYIGSIDADYDDVRVLKSAATTAIRRAIKAGSRRPLLCLVEYPQFINSQLVTLLGVLEALYTPIQVREFNPSKAKKVDYLGVWTENKKRTALLIPIAQKLETSRRIACDIGDADPERMSPPRVEEYVKHLFVNTPIKVTTISDIKDISREYPLFEAVNRAASCQERHRGRLMFLEYNPVGPVEKTFFLVGKGVTYDTGGADVKVGGHMLGMSRDKCGAAAVVGFMNFVKETQPKNIRVVAGIGIVRNSIGSNSYVADEVITARSGARVRVINTDAEGRMIMADILCKFKEEALSAVNPHLFTIATLTGHACLTVGLGYSIVVDNGPAYKASFCRELQQYSEEIGDPFEISTLRREDIKDHRGVAEGDDVVQGQPKPSSQSMRGHQGPVAFLLLASGLDKYGSASDTPLKYSHLDIAGSAGDLPNPATGAPVLALANTLLKFTVDSA